MHACMRDDSHSSCTLLLLWLLRNAFTDMHNRSSSVAAVAVAVVAHCHNCIDSQPAVVAIVVAAAATDSQCDRATWLAMATRDVPELTVYRDCWTEDATQASRTAVVHRNSNSRCHIVAESVAANVGIDAAVAAVVSRSEYWTSMNKSYSLVAVAVAVATTLDCQNCVVHML